MHRYVRGFASVGQGAAFGLDAAAGVLSGSVIGD
jgi:hypothetical protein